VEEAQSGILIINPPLCDGLCPRTHGPAKRAVQSRFVLRLDGSESRRIASIRSLLAWWRLLPPEDAVVDGRFDWSGERGELDGAVNTTRGVIE
jgi:hypothetical protein